VDIFSLTWISTLGKLAAAWDEETSTIRERAMTSIENAYAFTAIRGIQSGREYYVAMCPLKVVPRLFLFNDAELPPELRAQRVLNRSRVPDIARYLVNNSRDYILSSLTASVDGKMTFEPSGEEPGARNTGRLLLPMTARFLINDGQHRRAAIEAALKERPELGDETVSVIFFADTGLKRSQQIFADLNRHVVRPTTSLNILYDHRDPLAQATCRLVDRVSVFKDLTEMERTTVPSRSPKLHCLCSIYQATRALLGRTKRQSIAQAHEDKAGEFWEEVGRRIPEWKMAADKKVSCIDLRQNYVHAHGVAVVALGIMGGALLAQEPHSWKTKLKALRKIDWRRSCIELWEGRALVDGRISKAQVNLVLTANLIKNTVGVALGAEDKQMESRFLSGRDAA
jgi:DNA sulfur modification protein DndB